MKKNSIAKGLLEIGAITVKGTDDLFTWVSGIKSPIYCDNRLIISYPKFRDEVANAYVDMIKKDFEDVDVIAGTATAGIPHAAWIAQILNKPMVYIRSSKKEHGKGNQIEGCINKGDRVVVIEDLLSTGGSSISAVEALREVEAEVLKVYGIFNYNFPKLTEVFKNANIEFETITDYLSLMDILVEEGAINNEEYMLLKKWSENPQIFTI